MQANSAATVALTCFDAPLPAAWQAAQIEPMTASERTRLARIHRPLRRDQFIVGHALLRRLLAILKWGATDIHVDADGRPVMQCGRCQVSIAHSGRAVAAIAAPGPEPVGIDIEAVRALGDPRGAAAWLGLATDPPPQSEQILTTWVAAEAGFKAGLETPGTQCQTRWQDYLIAVAGVATAPQTLVFDCMTGTYNRAELHWNTVESAAKQQG